MKRQETVPARLYGAQLSAASGRADGPLLSSYRLSQRPGTSGTDPTMRDGFVIHFCMPSKVRTSIYVFYVVRDKERDHIEGATYDFPSPNIFDDRPAPPCLRLAALADFSSQRDVRLPPCAPGRMWAQDPMTQGSTFSGMLFWRRTRTIVSPGRSV